MPFTRTGTCNRCGECCGYPRSTDGGQNNPWPPDWPDCLKTWTPESVQQNLPILQFTTDMVNTPYDNFTIKGHRCYWIWVTGHGLCTDLPVYGDVASYDQRCPLLGAKQGDGTVPCFLIGTTKESVWRLLCEPVPPVEFATQGEIDKWYANCPSCSYSYVEV